jgi:HEPN domain-containing protein
MFNSELAKDYIIRCKSRLKAIQCLFDERNWPDVVRESQEVVELVLKALLRHHGIDFPRIHDVSSILESEKHRLPLTIADDLVALGKISKSLRRDRELAFYGGEDVTPLNFYSESDAKTALKDAKMVFDKVAPYIMDESGI